MTQGSVTEQTCEQQRMRADRQRVVESDPLRPTLVRASAGTGKTYQLTARLLRILLQGAAPETILATTFTRKAAGEILDRVLLTLAEAADPDDDDALQRLREQVGIATLPRSACRQLLEKLVRNIHRLRICTLDSLFAQLARSFPFELGLPPAWRLTDEIEEGWLRERAVDGVVSTLDQSEMTAMLSMLGKGEVRRSVSRELLQVVDAAYSIQRQCGPEVWKRLIAPRQPDPDELLAAATAFRQSQPRQKRHRTKLEQLADRLERGELDQLVGDTLIGHIGRARRGHCELLYGRAPFPEGLDQAFDRLYAAVRSQVLSLLCAQNEATGDVLIAYDHHIESLKTASRSLGFEDVTVRLAQQFNRLDERSIARRMDGVIDHVLLDEFQDTSPAQWQVLLPLIRRVTETDEASGTVESRDQLPRSFFCVGDTKQAIYGWRGGVAEIFDAVTDEINDIDVVRHNTSYRSSPVVIEAVNRTFANLPRHPLVAEANQRDPSDKAAYEAAAIRRFARRFPRHTSIKRQLPGHVKLLTASGTEQPDVESRRRSCFETAADLTASINRQQPAASIGVLTRTNRGVAEMIYLLERDGVDVSQEGGNPLTDSVAVELVLSTLMMVEHPGDGRWAFHVQGSPLGPRQEIESGQLRRRIEDCGITETIEFIGGLLAPYCDDRETLRLKQLVHESLRYERQPSPRLRDFVRRIREKRVERPRAAAVRVMTVHQAKGLEFDAVVLPELDGNLARPSGNCIADIRNLARPPRGITRYLNQKSWHFLSRRWQRAFGQQAEAVMTEALCLLYVAMTRARQSLQLVIAPAKKAEFTNRTPASLVYHALDCQADPSRAEQTLFELGDPGWAASIDREPMAAEAEPRQSRIRFRPLPELVRRNQPERGE